MTEHVFPVSLTRATVAVTPADDKTVSINPVAVQTVAVADDGELRRLTMNDIQEA